MQLAPDGLTRPANPNLKSLTDSERKRCHSFTLKKQYDRRTYRSRRCDCRRARWNDVPRRVGKQTYGAGDDLREDAEALGTHHGRRPGENGHVTLRFK